MQPWDLFTLIAQAEYTKIGDDLDYTVKEIEGCAYLLFQCSATDEDWKNNFAFVRKVYKDQENTMLVHGGYAKVWKSGNDQVMKEFIEAVKRNPDQQPVIAGWSFGGAMSVLAAEDFHYRTGIKAKVVTFGGPKVAGSIKTKKYLASIGMFSQYTERNDVVPLMPPLPWFHQINTIKIGDKFCIARLFSPQNYHTRYDHEEDYK